MKKENMIKIFQKILQNIISITMLIFIYYSTHYVKDINLLPNTIAILLFFSSGVTLFLLKKDKSDIVQLLKEQLITCIQQIILCFIIKYNFKDTIELTDIRSIVVIIIMFIVLSVFINSLVKHYKKCGYYVYIAFYDSCITFCITLFTLKLNTIIAFILSFSVFIFIEYNGWKRHR